MPTSPLASLSKNLLTCKEYFQRYSYHDWSTAKTIYLVVNMPHTSKGKMDCNTK
jgi:hypothetical protein